MPRDHLTTVELTFIEKKIEHRIRFGRLRTRRLGVERLWRRRSRIGRLFADQCTSVSDQGADTNDIEMSC